MESFELSEQLGIDSEYIKKLLQAVGYRCGNYKKLYIHQGDVNEIREKFSEVTFYKHG